MGRRTGLGVSAMLLAIALTASTSRAQPTIVRDPYADVDWATDVRLKTQFHDHTNTNPNRVQDYDDAGYDVISLFNYSGNYTVPYAYTERIWPPEDWMDPAFLASLVNIDFFIPNAEEIAYQHLTSPFLTEFIDRWDPLTWPVQQPWQYTSTQEGIDSIAALGGIPILAHPWTTPALWTDLERYHALEVYNAFGLGSFLIGTQTYDLNDDLAPLWDSELSEARHIFAVAVNDHWGPPAGAWTVLDSGKTIVLSHGANPVDFRDAVERGAMFAVKDLGTTKDQYPVVSAISVGPGSITVSTSDSVTWIADGAIVASGSILALAIVPESAHYVRAEVSNAEGSVVFTQPFFFEQLCGDVTDDGVVDDLDVDAFRLLLADPIGVPLSVAGERKCTVIGTPNGCDLLNAIALRRAVESPGLPPGIAQSCPAANP